MHNFIKAPDIRHLGICFVCLSPSLYINFLEKEIGVLSCFVFLVSFWNLLARHGPCCLSGSQ